MNTKIDRTQPAVNVTAATFDTSIDPVARGFNPSIDGTVRIVNQDGTEVDVYVKGGGIYPIFVREIKTVGTTGGMSVTLLH